MRLFLLDTNIVSDLIRRPQGAVAGQIALVSEPAVVTSIIVSAELRFGAERAGSKRLRTQMEAVLRLLPVLPLDGEVDRRYGVLRADLERRGCAIGGNDMLIAAHALALDATLVTDNVDEFARVPDLRVVNWLPAR